MATWARRRFASIPSARSTPTPGTPGPAMLRRRSGSAWPTPTAMSSGCFRTTRAPATVLVYGSSLDIPLSERFAVTGAANFITPSATGSSGCVSRAHLLSRGRGGFRAARRYVCAAHDRREQSYDGDRSAALERAIVFLIVDVPVAGMSRSARRLSGGPRNQMEAVIDPSGTFRDVPWRLAGSERDAAEPPAARTRRRDRRCSRGTRPGPGDPDPIVGAQTCRSRFRPGGRNAARAQSDHPACRTADEALAMARADGGSSSGRLNDAGPDISAHAET